MSTTQGTAGASRNLGMLVLAAAAGAAGWAIYASITEPTPNDGAVPRAEAAAEGPKASKLITALGRIEPKDGVIRLAGPSQAAAVIARLLVEKGDKVQSGQVIAVLDTHDSLKADLTRVQAELDHAKSEYERLDKLYSSKVISVSERDAWRVKANMLEAERQHAEVALALAAVRAPVSGQVLDVHARAGEKVGPDGIVELGKTDEMYAIAEVYETDIGRVRDGQQATVSSPALGEPLHGTVERIGNKIGKLNLLDVDPVAKTDARVVEVEVRLDDGERVASLTNLQVQVAITP